MLKNGSVQVPDGRERGLSRRDFLTAGAAGLAGLALPELVQLHAAPVRKPRIRSCIAIFLVGSPGHLDTWDMKPDAPAEIRGPFRPIATNVNGIRICEHFPRLAQRMDRIALVRSLHYESGTHESGQRWMMTGADFSGDGIRPHFGSVVSSVLGRKSAWPASVILPGPIGNTGAGSLHGQSAGHLGDEHEPVFPGDDPSRYRRLLVKENDRLRDRYGRGKFGQSCLLARRLVEAGVRCVTVNHFDTVFGIRCWDMHADGGRLNSTLDDYERHLCPEFDLGFTALIDDLAQRGLLEETVVAVLSEFGRTPRLNCHGGRDHYPGVWTNFLCGGGIRGGQVIGASDRTASAPADNPIAPPQFLASIYHAMGIDLDRTTIPGPDGLPTRLIDAEPIDPLFI